MQCCQGGDTDTTFRTFLCLQGMVHCIKSASNSGHLFGASEESRHDPWEKSRWSCWLCLTAFCVLTYHVFIFNPHTLCSVKILTGKKMLGHKNDELFIWKKVSYASHFSNEVQWLLPLNIIDSKLKGMGDVKAMQVIWDLNGPWDKEFQSPACIAKDKGYKLTFDDRTVYYKLNIVGGISIILAWWLKFWLCKLQWVYMHHDTQVECLKWGIRF